MARNEEKALTLFNKWETFKKDFHSSASNRRPLQATDCESLPEAEKWRRDLIRDITKKISIIQNGSLGEYRIREINDEINKMMRQKYFWETRIKELGGDVQKGRQFYDIDGKELPGAPGYKYYGSAKELPGVRELFAEREDELRARRSKRTRADMYKNITPDYYGYRDDDDGVLEKKEAIREAELLAVALTQHKARKDKVIGKARQARSSSSMGNSDGGGSSSNSSSSRLGSVLTAEELKILECSDDDDAEDEPAESEVHIKAGQQDLILGKAAEEVVRVRNSATTSQQLQAPPPQQQQQLAAGKGMSASTDAAIKSHVAVPSQDDINQLILAEKRRALLEKITSL